MGNKNPRRKIDCLNETNGRCFYCGLLLDGIKFHIDHFNPKSNGGAGIRGNNVASCVSCNCTKSNYSIEVFRKIVEKREKRKVLFFFEYYGIIKSGNSVRYQRTLNERMF